jgi:endonuclease/exonuclease/phosphatase family metal-dependent hydrolase
MQLTFASYNIHKAVGLDGKRDPERIIAVLRELHADVIALQESDRRFGERESVLPKAMLDDTPWRAAPVAKRPRSLEPRGAVRADLLVEGRRLRVLGAHLDLSGLRRRDQIRAMLGHCERCDTACPTVLMGDFNQWGRSRGALREFAAPWQSLTMGNSFPSRRPLAQLDRIVHSGDWSCHEAAVHHSALAAVASDHLPVRATLSLTA